MGFVVVFLITFLFATKLMSKIVWHFGDNDVGGGKDLSPEDQFVIKDAIKQHINSLN